MAGQKEGILPEALSPGPCPENNACPWLPSPSNGHLTAIRNIREEEVLNLTKFLEADEGETLPVVPQSVLDKSCYGAEGRPGGQEDWQWSGNQFCKRVVRTTASRGMRKRPLTYC